MASMTHDWCRDNPPGGDAFGLEKVLIPITQNLWAFLHEKDEELPPATSVEQFTTQRQAAWVEISLDPFTTWHPTWLGALQYQQGEKINK